ncbi:MAG: radical SAM protein [Calditrichaeota bacterium]|nr:radical SAM protein [Calditrichota bacterium]
MKTDVLKHIYGPVFSRRLGRSLGVDLVPFKTCTYDCIYCQLGRTTNKTIDLKEYVNTNEVLLELEQLLSTRSDISYISLAGSGEPTLHSQIGKLIERITDITDIPVAVLTNGSLLWMDEVKEALIKADLILPSLDAGDENSFRYVNRPHKGIPFTAMVDGIAEFTHCFQGDVALEVLLLDGVTGIQSEVKKIDALARRIQPARIQLNTASRPPVEEFAFRMSHDQLKKLSKFFSGNVEVILDNEENDLQASSERDVTQEEIISLLKRRPCTLNGISSGLNLHSLEVLKKLEEMDKRGLVNSVRRDGATYFEFSN